MNELTHLEWNATIDRLVEGELSPGEVKGIVEHLEGDAVRCKQVALAFIEQQSWRRSIKSIVNQGQPDARSVTKSWPVCKPHAPPTLGRPSRSVSLALALSCLFFFGVLLGTQFVHDRGAVLPVRLSAGAPASVPDRPPGGLANVGPRSLHHSEQSPFRVAVLGSVQIGDPDLTEQRVPIIAGAGLDEEWLRSQAPALSAKTREDWAKRGWEIDQRRRIMSVQLADGRKLMIPIDVVNYRPVGRMIN